MIRWFWSLFVRPTATLRLAVAGGAPVSELVTATVILSSFYAAVTEGVRYRSVLIGLNAALFTVVFSAVGIWLQVLLMWASARLLGWREGTMGQMFQGYGPVFALVNVALVMVSWIPELAGYQAAVVALAAAGTLWQTVLLVLAVRLVTGLGKGWAALAVLPAILLWDVPWLVLNARVAGSGT